MIYKNLRELNSLLSKSLFSAATKDIKQGEIVIRERPLLSGPNGLMGLWPVCLACFRTVTTVYVCPNCNWPMCDAECAQV